MNRSSMNSLVRKISVEFQFKGALMALSILLMASNANASIEQLADVPLPVNTDIQIVSDNMIHNGNRMSLATYSSALSLEESTDFYRQVWSSEDSDRQIPGLVETRVGEWLLISRLQHGFNTVIQLKLAEPHKSTGYLSIMPVPGLASDEPAMVVESRAPLPDGLEILSSTTTLDGSRLSRLTVYSSSYSIESAARHYVRHMLNQNWTLVSRRSHAQSKVVLMNKKSKRLELVVSGEPGSGGSVIVVNETQDRG